VAFASHFAADPEKDNEDLEDRRKSLLVLVLLYYVGSKVDLLRGFMRA
jgi:hypothetical protein